VGLTEEELLDIIWELPHPADGSLPRLDLSALDTVTHPVARATLERLQALRRNANATTPYDILSQAIDVLRVRPILRQRHRDQAERALSNVDLYLDLSRPYAVRGLRAFAEAMTAAWTDESRAVEGRPDAQEEAVALYTIHAAKGLEWPIVVPINTMTQINAPESAVTDRKGKFHCPVLGVKPQGYEQAREAEKAELNRERIRLWYVAATRARDLLVLPRMDVTPRSSAWISLLDLGKEKLPPLALTAAATDTPRRAESPGNPQSQQVFRAEAATVADSQHRITWLSPSMEESKDTEEAKPEESEEPVLHVVEKEILLTSIDGEVPENAPPSVQGGRERGIILHKLIEEVLTRETQETEQALAARAQVLIQSTGLPIAEDPRKGLVPTELAQCVIRALSLAEIKPLRPYLKPEYPVYSSVFSEGKEEATTGIADAIAFQNGRSTVIIDWKSDVNPDPKTIEHYQKQVSAYLEMTGTELGLIVLATTGRVIQVKRTAGGSGSSAAGKRP
jgi:exodeoxyribonuclease-5